MPRLRRVLDELCWAPPAHAGEAALGRLHVRDEPLDAKTAALVADAIPGEGANRDACTIDGPGADGDVLFPVRGPGASPRAAASHDVVRIAPGVFAAIPGTAARVRLLQAAAARARCAVVLHVLVSSEGSHLGRALIDAPRAVLRRVGLPAPQRGDRFGRGAYVHCYFDEEALLAELHAAGLDIAARRGTTFVLTRAGAHAGEPGGTASFARELVRVLRLVPKAERGRRTAAPEHVLRAMRARGKTQPVRSRLGRARLRRAIGWVDALVPGGANCYRRTLLELGLDAGAARENVVFGLDVGATGHVAFEDQEDPRFDVTFTVRGS